MAGSVQLIDVAQVWHKIPPPMSKLKVAVENGLTSDDTRIMFAPVIARTGVVLIKRQANANHAGTFARLSPHAQQQINIVGLF